MTQFKKTTPLPLLLSLLVSILLSTDLKGQIQHHYSRIIGTAQGTTYQILYHPNSSHLHSDSITSLLQIIDNALSLYLPNSLISSFNASSSGIKADQHLLAVVKRSIDISTATFGAFDITCKPLMDMWGFGIIKRKNIPSTKEIRQTLIHCGFNKLFIQGDSILKKDPAIQIDCNGIAQGYTVDKIAELMERNNIEDYMVELGGEVRVKGNNPKGNAWVIGIHSGDPDLEENTHQYSISTQQGGITTSGTKGKTRTYKRRSFSHILDPRSGRPVNASMIAVTVFALDAMTADALDNALMVMGPDESLQFLKTCTDIEAFLTYLGKDGMIKHMMTPGMNKLCSIKP
jgi:thiamine biosynthesis lipoprotein